MIIKYLYMIIVGVIFYSCSHSNSYEKTQNSRNKIRNVKNEIVDIKTPVILGNTVLSIVDDVLIVTDIKSNNNGIHLFNKNTFEYITSTGTIGRGPGEISRYGDIVSDNSNRNLWVSDYGKKVIWKFSVDSVVNNKQYFPSKEINLSPDFFLAKYDFVNDSVALGKAIKVVDNNTFVERTSKYNIPSKKLGEYGYEHPKALGAKSRSYFGLSVENNLYVNCYSFCDLMTICDLQGNLKYNVYGPDGIENDENKKMYYGQVDILSKKIIAAYSGNNRFRINKYKRLESIYPSKFLVFDLLGNYVETIETGHSFTFFCVDEDNDRIIAFFEDRDNPLGYFNLNSSK